MRGRRRPCEMQRRREMLPREFAERMEQMLGKEAAAFFESYEREPCRALRVNPLKGSLEEFLRKCPFQVSPVPWEKYGLYYGPGDAPGRHPWHEAGVYYIQEPSAMAPAACLQAQPGERVLDLCAAPGGKSTQIGAALAGRGLLVSSEIHPARARILSENIERMGIRNALVLNETPGRLAQVFEGYFDAVLADAPCSGEGMFRKSPEAVGEWSPENVELCAGRQDEILDCGARMLRPGGRLVYSTCTFAPQENEGSVARFLDRHPEFSLVPVWELPGFPWGEIRESERGWRDWCGEPGGRDMRGTLRIWPHLAGGEGHFTAVLRREGDPARTGDVRSLHGLQRTLPEKELGEYPDFRTEYLREDLRGVYLKFGDQIYLGPEGMPCREGLKVLRPGLHLGTLKKNRFEPSHALALALSAREAPRIWQLHLEDGSAQAFLRGETFPAAGEKGWYLMTLDGYSMGWGKLAGGVMKNHYPRGLRK